MFKRKIMTFYFAVYTMINITKIQMVGKLRDFILDTFLVYCSTCKALRNLWGFTCPFFVVFFFVMYRLVRPKFCSKRYKPQVNFLKHISEYSLWLSIVIMIILVYLAAGCV